ncbi:DUF2953 domain-containing protein [uncultured Methanoregula sp.]|uniref:DUF2953 domain-containing protein n=1 Tax=uncultured Methanoregula sp. TaxID=1005933 RepID=UPI002AAADB98|nr:DUF2953 domain-containing protein [uncultured Methanoregula sp.]
MDVLLLPALLLLCLLILILIPVIILYAIPVRSVLKFTTKDGTLRETVTVTWCLIGIEIAHDPVGTKAGVLVGSHILYTFFFDREHGPAPRAGEPETPVRLQAAQKKSIRLSYKLIQPLESLGSVLWQESRFEGATGRITLGLGDPAQTGLCYGYYWASRFVLEALRIHIEIEPVFDREVFSCDMDIRMSLRHPLRVIIAAVRLALNPAVRDVASVFRQRTPGAAAA